jgi:hypothetical protein
MQCIWIKRLSNEFLISNHRNAVIVAFELRREKDENKKRIVLIVENVKLVHPVGKIQLAIVINLTSFRYFLYWVILACITAS